MNSTDFSLTIGIPTYNRRNKLDNLLKQFIELSKAINIREYNIKILVSDNASTDDTEAMINGHIKQLQSCGYEVEYNKQEHNLGMDGNFKYIYENCKTDYLWYFSDDDILIIDSVKPLLDDLILTRPAICLSNFIQNPFSRENTIFLKDIEAHSQVFNDISKCVNSIIKYPKLTNYIIKKIDLSRCNQLLYDCIGDYYLHVAITLLVFNQDKKLLLRKGSIAKSDSDYMSIEYSPKAFSGLKRTVNKVVNSLGDEYQKFIVKECSNDTLHAVLTYLIMHYKGQIQLSNNILQEEIEYIRNSRLEILKSPKLYIKYIHFILALILPDSHKRQSFSRD